MDNPSTTGRGSSSLTGLLLPHRPQLTPALPHTGHRLPQFFVRDVQVPLRLLDVGMAEHQLNRADVHVLRQEATRALVTEVVPVQVDLPELGPIDAGAWLGALRVVAIGDQEQRLLGRLEVGHELASRRSEHVRVWAERRAALQDRRQACLWVEWNAAILRILRMTTGNRDLVSLPVDVPVLNPQHLAPATTGLQRADDAVVHGGTDVLVFGSPHLPGCCEQRLFLVQSETTIALGLLLCSDRSLRIGGTALSRDTADPGSGPS